MKIRLMDSTGDTVMEFDAAAEAKDLLDRIKSEGKSVFARSGKRVDSVNDLEDENVVVPKIVGG